MCVCVCLSFISVIYDCCSFYAHHEYEWGIMTMFGDPGEEFRRAYHRLIPKQDGFDDRVLLYRLFHTLNHW